MTGYTTPQAAGAHCAPVSSAGPATAATSDTGASERLELTIAGMTCGHCVRAVSDALDALPGIEVDHVRIGHASLWFEPGTASPAAVIEAIREAGYQASFAPGTGARGGAQATIGLPQAPTGGSCCSG